jgi:hypothetical protein
MTKHNLADLAEAIDALRAETAELKAQLAKVGGAAKPPAPIKSEPYQPIDYTSRASMDRETMKDLASAIPPDLARDLRGDLARGSPVTASVAQLTPDRPGVEVQRGSGWSAPNPLRQPEGVAICDRLVDRQDELDKLDLARRLAQAGAGVKKE